MTRKGQRAVGARRVRRSSARRGVAGEWVRGSSLIQGVVCDDALVSVADHQTLRVLEGRYVLERAVADVEVARDGEVLAVVRGPDGGACMRRRDAADDAWVALWNGDEAHPPDATGMLAAIVAPLEAGNVPVWVAASFDGDMVLIPVDQVDEASELLRRAGHRVIG